LKESLIQDIHKIRTILKSFKKSDFHSGTNFYSCLNGFPAGCCGDTTNLLGLFIIKMYDKRCIYISATGLGKNKDLSHAWLSCDDYIIDITADQFNSIGYNLKPVIISKVSVFHAQFIKTKFYELNVDKLKYTPVYSVFERVILEMQQDERNI